MKRFVLFLLVLIGFLWPQADVTAKATYESGYGYERTWNAALRLVRVDLGFKVTEKDDQNGYLLFEYHSTESGKQTTPGSLEIVRSEGDRVKVVAQLPQMPAYHEQVLVDQLSRKLRTEFGEPRKLERSSSSGRPSDAGSD
jgi:hypothetical protein